MNTMFTLEQTKTAHSKVKSGADFPAYINDIKQLGVTGYETFVSDGHTDYYGTNDFKISTVARYNTIIQLFAATVLHQELKNGLYV